jgi:heme exporter protein C
MLLVVPPFARIVLDRLGSPGAFYRMAGRLVPWCAGAALGLTVLALALAWLVAPADTARGGASRIVFVHVPAAWASLLLYFAMAAWAAATLASRGRIPALMMSALAPTGILFTTIALWTGWLLGKPSPGDGWAWDAQLACEVILFALYAAVLALRSATGDPHRADRAIAVLVLVGCLNLPFIYYSLSWWQGLHDRAAGAAQATASGMLGGMLLLALAFCMYAKAVALARVRFLMLERTAQRRWLAREGAA